MALCTLLLAQMAGVDHVLGVVSLAGGCFVLVLAWEAWRADRPDLEDRPPGRSLLKGVIANFLSPHPYLFWLTVGSPMLVVGWSEGSAGPVLFLVGFYGMLVGSKSLIAIAAGRWRHLLTGRAYILVNRTMGLLLAVFAIRFFAEGWQMLGGGHGG